MNWGDSKNVDKMFDPPLDMWKKMSDLYEFSSALLSKPVE